MFSRVLPYLTAFVGALALTLALTPLVRALNRRLGMIDKPDARRINKVPIPRGGGLAIVVGFTLTCLFLLPTHADVAASLGSSSRFFWCLALSVAMAAVGYVDDKFSLPPKVKLAGQIVLAFLTWFCADLGFSDLWPSLPVWLDGVLTVFWIVGAVNAFNLIDGLDGLATGLAFIASVGMAGALFCSGHAGTTIIHIAFAGALLGFLRYNYNPASVFLGDCGSMFIGYVIAVLPLCSHAADSFLVSVGVPLLAMGVPIFDTSLAIFRRSVRRLLNRRIGQEAQNGHVMTADVDHLHHRILRSVGFNQRKAAWSLYALAVLFVVIGICALLFRNRAAGIWIAALVVVSFIIFRDAARIELFDTGRLLNTVAHGQAVPSRRRWARLAVPFWVVADLVMLVAVFFGVTLVLDKPLFESKVLLTALPIRVFAIFAMLAVFRVYRTVWSRAMLSNYTNVLLACILGSLIGTVVVYYAPLSNARLLTGTILYAVLPFCLVCALRLLRSGVRDLFYHIDCQRLKGRKDVSRILVYGTGLRYRTFRRELVRSASQNDRIIVGLIDDDLLMRGHYIGGLRVLGTLTQAPEIINALNVDTVIVACEIEDTWKEIVRKTLCPTGVKIRYFSFNESDL